MTPVSSLPSRRPVFRFSQGQLCITTAQEEMRLGTWPLLEATRRRKGEAKWSRFVPAFRLLRPKHDLLAIEAGPAGVRGQGVDPLLEKHQAFRLFRQSLPPRLALAAERFPARQWAVLRMVQEREEAVELLEQNPALGFCTANLARFRTISGNHGRQAAELSRRPQREVLAWLGFPDEQAWVNIVRKLLPETVTVERVLALREVAGDEDMAKRLAHVPAINTGVLELACQTRLLSLISPTLLAEIASAEEERKTTITLPLALTQVFCYRVVAVASVECYPKLEAMNGNCQQVGAEGNLGSGARSV